MADNSGITLSERKYWEELYVTDTDKEWKLPITLRLLQKVKRGLGHVFGKRMQRFTESHASRVLREKLLAGHLPRGSEYSFVEVGSAPGVWPIQMRERFGFNVFGVEYTSNGVKLNRINFEKNGIPADHVIQGDITSEAFVNLHRSQFDIVNSNGLIEHFTDPKKVIEGHIALLKPGGWLFVIIPNLRGINYYLSHFFHPGILDIHNLDIMDKKAYAALFDQPGMEPVYMGYWGVFSMGLYNTNSNPFRRALFFLALIFFHLLINPLLNLFFSNARPQLKYASPYLVYLGRKKADV